MIEKLDKSSFTKNNNNNNLNISKNLAKKSYACQSINFLMTFVLSISFSFTAALSLTSNELLAFQSQIVDNNVFLDSTNHNNSDKNLDYQNYLQTYQDNHNLNQGTTYYNNFNSNAYLNNLVNYQYSYASGFAGPYGLGYILPNNLYLISAVALASTAIIYLVNNQLLNPNNNFANNKLYKNYNYDIDASSDIDSYYDHKKQIINKIHAAKDNSGKISDFNEKGIKTYNLLEGDPKDKKYNIIFAQEELLQDLSKAHISFLAKKKKHLDNELIALINHIEQIEYDYIEQIMLLTKYRVFRHYTLLNDSLLNPHNSIEDSSFHFVRIKAMEYITHPFWSQNIVIDYPDNNFGWQEIITLGYEVDQLLINTIAKYTDNSSNYNYYNQQLDSIIDEYSQSSKENIYKSLGSFPSSFNEVQELIDITENKEGLTVEDYSKYIDQSHYHHEKLINYYNKITKIVEINKLIQSIESLYIQKSAIDSEVNTLVNTTSSGYEDQLFIINLKKEHLELGTVYEEHIDLITNTFAQMAGMSNIELKKVVKNNQAMVDKIISRYDSISSMLN